MSRWIAARRGRRIAWYAIGIALGVGVIVWFAIDPSGEIGRGRGVVLLIVAPIGIVGFAVRIAKELRGERTAVGGGLWPRSSSRERSTST